MRRHRCARCSAAPDGAGATARDISPGRTRPGRSTARSDADTAMHVATWTHFHPKPRPNTAITADGAASPRRNKALPQEPACGTIPSYYVLCLSNSESDLQFFVFRHRRTGPAFTLHQDRAHARKNSYFNMLSGVGWNLRWRIRQKPRQNGPSQHSRPEKIPPWSARRRSAFKTSARRSARPS